MNILTNAATNGASPPVAVREDAMDAVAAAWGDFGGGTVTLEHSPDEGVSWIPLHSFGAEEVKAVDVPHGLMRANVSGATSPNVSLRVDGIVVKPTVVHS